VGVIFDLDLTLIDSSIAEPLRRQRAWSDVYSLVRQFTVYPGISQLLAELRTWGVPCAIVTSSPRPYCTLVVATHSFQITEFVCYHDTTRRKPHPDPMEKALKQLALECDGVVAVGDEPKDIQSARACGITTVAATWGTLDESALLATSPDVVAATVADLHELLADRFAP
jgi:HAD superfamily hydrolase (TIGR01662 family)